MTELEKCIACYQEKYRFEFDKEADYYKEIDILSEAIKLAAKAKTYKETKHSHQHRIPLQTLDAMSNKLSKKEIDFSKAKCFDDIIQIIKIEKIKGFGELCIYDTALRIGYNLSIEPSKVYLHAGPAKGAKYFRFKNQNRNIIEYDELPNEFQTELKSKRINYRHIEAILCTFKSGFNREEC